MNQARIYTVIIFSLVLGLVTAYNGCGEVRFDTSPELLQQQQLEFNSTSAVVINSGDPYTNSKSVQLTLTSPRAVDMRVSRQPDCSDGTWERYSTYKAWTLDQENAPGEVFAQFKDLRGNISPCTNDSIVHDNIAPTASFTNPANFMTNQGPLTVRWDSRDNLSGVASTTCTDTNTVIVPCSAALNASADKEGANTVFVQVTDAAGNTSPKYNYTWIYDKTPPVVVINAKPAQLTGAQVAHFEFSASDALTGIGQYMCRVDNQAYQPCTSPKDFSNLGAGAHTFNVYATDMAGNTSLTVNVAWNVDLSAPNIRFTQNPPSVSGSSQATFAFDGTDDGQPISQFECSIDAGSFVACSSPRVVNNLNDGVHTFEVLGIDSVGNRSVPLRYSWLIDTRPPTVQITQAPGPFNNSTSVNVQWMTGDTGSGVARVECRLDGAGFSSCPANGSTFSNLTEGAHTITVRVTDNGGNSASATHTWTTDLTAPTVIITSGPPPFTSSTDATIVFSGTDANGLAGFECRSDAGVYSSCSSPLVMHALTEGGHSVSVRAIDRAGNVSTAPAGWSWTIDRTGPLIRIISRPSNVMQGRPALVNYDVLDAAAGMGRVECGLTLPNNSVVACPNSATRDLGNLAIGSYTYEIRAWDILNNPSVERFTFEVAATPLVCDPFTLAGEALCNGGMVGEIFYLDSPLRTQFNALSNKTVDFFYSNGIRINAILNLNQLFVPTRSFTSGFPTNSGTLITDSSGATLFEYFAFRLNTVVKLDPLYNLPGYYQFATLSDDGTVVMITPQGSSPQILISNDGDHPTRLGCATQAIYFNDTTRLAMQIKYYQGPRTEIAASLLWRRVESPIPPAEALCGVSGNTTFFGASYNDMTSSGYGTLVNNGWKPVAPTNLIAP